MSSVVGECGAEAQGSSPVAVTTGEVGEAPETNDGKTVVGERPLETRSERMVSGSVTVTVTEDDDGEYWVEMRGEIDTARFCDCVTEGLSKRMNSLWTVEQAVNDALTQYYSLVDEALLDVADKFSEEEQAILFRAVNETPFLTSGDSVCTAGRLADLIEKWSAGRKFRQQYPCADYDRLITKVRRLTGLELCAIRDWCLMKAERVGKDSADERPVGEVAVGAA